MSIKRYELHDGQWAKIARLLPGKVSDPGCTGSDNRLFVNGCLWALRSGAHWCDLPERYGRWKIVHRFDRWCHAGVWEHVFAALAADRDNQYLMIDSTIVRAHQQAATGKEGQESGDGAFPRRTDDQIHRLHMLPDALGRPLRFIITAGQAGDITIAPALLEGQTGNAAARRQGL